MTQDYAELFAQKLNYGILLGPYYREACNILSSIQVAFLRKELKKKHIILAGHTAELKTFLQLDTFGGLKFRRKLALNHAAPYTSKTPAE